MSFGEEDLPYEFVVNGPVIFQSQKHASIVQLQRSSQAGLEARDGLADHGECLWCWWQVRPIAETAGRGFP